MGRTRTYELRHCTAVLQPLSVWAISLDLTVKSTAIEIQGRIHIVAMVAAATVRFEQFLDGTKLQYRQKYRKHCVRFAVSDISGYTVRFLYHTG